MAKQSRTLKLSILGDVSDLNKSLKTAGGDVDTFGDKIGKAGKMIGGAFAAAAAAAGAAAIAIGIEGVKAAIADEKAQTQLATALENSTGATKAQIKATEDSILQMSLATGVADDDLRPALGRLVRSTNDTEKAQELLAQALDISAATGKPVETVANALGKAFDGNTASLGKLGIGLSTAELATLSFEEVQAKLSATFGGAAAKNADTYAGQIARVQVAFDEAKETIGAALLPILGTLIDFINTKALPVINGLSGAFSVTGSQGFGKTISDVADVVKRTATPIFEAMKTTFDKIKAVIIDNKDNFKAFFDVVKVYAPLIGSTIGAAMKVIGSIASVVLDVFAKVLGAIKPLLNFAIDGINLVIKGLNLVKIGKDIPLIPRIGSTPSAGSFSGGAFSGTMPGGKNFNMGDSDAFDFGSDEVGGVIDATSDPVNIAKYSTNAIERAAAQKIVDERAFLSGFVSDSQNAARLAAAAGLSSGFVSDSQNAARLAAANSSGTTINLNVTGAVDAEGTARTIIDALNSSFYRGTGGATALVTT